MTSALPDSPMPAARTRSRLWAEMLSLFVGVPLLMLLAVGTFPLFPVLAVLLIVAIYLLSRTPGFAWRELWGGDLNGWLPFVGLYALVTAAVTLVLTLWLVPQSLLGFPRYAPDRWLMVMALYPIVSALPQEIIFRPLFFRRYGALFPAPALAVIANGAAFAIGHLFYQNPVAIGLTACSGIIIGWAYLRSGSFLLALLLHAIGGMIVFTIGLGRFFYHGAIPS
ncbi:MAG: CPBP family intramembrane glutamic endopeptidase [Pseudomonadota bacterium]